MNAEELWNWVGLVVIASLSIVILMPIHRFLYQRIARRISQDVASTKSDFVHGVVRVDTTLIRWATRVLAVSGALWTILTLLR